MRGAADARSSGSEEQRIRGAADAGNSPTSHPAGVRSSRLNSKFPLTANKRDRQHTQFSAKDGRVEEQRAEGQSAKGANEGGKI